MTLILFAGLVLGQDEGQVDRIMLRFAQRRERIQSQAEFSRLLAEIRGDLELFLADHPKDRGAARAAFHIAETYLWGNDFSTGLDKLRNVCDLYPDSEDAATAGFLIGQLLVRKDDAEGARKAFEDFIKKHPNDERVILAKSLIAVTLQNEKKYDEAAEILRQVRETYKDRKESWAAELQRAVVYHLQSKNDEAQHILELVILGCPDRSQVEVARNLKSKYRQVGDFAPNFSEKDLVGNVVSLEKLRGRVVILYFFDPAAPAAVTEVQFLQRAKKSFQENTVAIVAVAINTESRDAVNFRDMQKITWPILFDGRGLEGKLPRDYDVRGLPSLTVIDQKGKVRYFNVAGRDLENAVSGLLSEN